MEISFNPLRRKSFERLVKNFAEIIIEDQNLFDNVDKVNNLLEYVKERRKQNTIELC